MTSQNTEENCSQRVDVRGWSKFSYFSRRLFRRHVRGCSDGRPGLCSFRILRWRELDRIDAHRVVQVSTGNHRGEPPVDDQCFAKLTEHHIGWLQIPVNNTSTVCICQRIADIDKSIQQFPQTFCVVFRQRVASAGTIPIFACHIRERSMKRINGNLQTMFPQDPHHVVRRTIRSGLAGFIDGNDVGVFQLAGHFRFTLKLRQRWLRTFQSGLDHLQRNFAVQFRIDCFPHFSLTAASQDFTDLESSRFRRSCSRRSSRHSGIKRRHWFVERCSRLQICVSLVASLFTLSDIGFGQSATG